MAELSGGRRILSLVHKHYYVEFPEVRSKTIRHFRFTDDNDYRRVSIEDGSVLAFNMELDIVEEAELGGRIKGDLSQTDTCPQDCEQRVGILQ